MHDSPEREPLPSGQPSERRRSHASSHASGVLSPRASTSEAGNGVHATRTTRKRLFARIRASFRSAIGLRHDVVDAARDAVHFDVDGAPSREKREGKDGQRMPAGAPVTTSRSRTKRLITNASERYPKPSSPHPVPQLFRTLKVFSV